MWILAKNSCALYYAISALSEFHNTKNIPELKVSGLNYMWMSLRCLVNKIWVMRIDTVLATILILTISEFWKKNISTSI